MSSLPPRVSGALSSQYRLEQEIGAGGMATVYLAEIRLTANLRHPHMFRAEQ